MKRLTPLLAFAVLAFGTTARANDVDPFGFEKDHFVTSKSRAEVVADRQAAQAAGLLPIPGELGVRVAETRSVKSRAQVVAETLEAQRLGLLTYGEVGPRQATPDEERQIQTAGRQALERMAKARRSTGEAGG
jgi:hypothetical protein